MRRVAIPAMAILMGIAGCRSVKEAEEGRVEDYSAEVSRAGRRELVKDEMRLRLTDAYIELDSVELEGCGGERMRALRARIIGRERTGAVRRETEELADSEWRECVSRHSTMRSERKESGGGGWPIWWIGIAGLIGIFFLTLWRK